MRPPSFVSQPAIRGDTPGAVAVGWKAALIKRIYNDLLGVGPQPQIVGDDLNDVAAQLIERPKERTDAA